MTRKTKAIAGVCIFFTVAYIVGTQLSFVTQIVESDGHRTTEYGIFGTSFPLKNEAVADLVVRDDVAAHIGAVAPPPIALNIQRPSMSVRITRPQNTEWTVNTTYTGDANVLVNYYKKQLSNSVVDKHSGMTTVFGKGRDGSDVIIWVYGTGAKKGVYEVGFKVTSRF